MAYDEFGVPEVAASVQGFNNPFGFTGYQTDKISELYYAQARYYSPANGRFFAEDPIKDRLNWYGYCNANPVAFIDPTGLAEDHFSAGSSSSALPPTIGKTGAGSSGIVTTGGAATNRYANTGRHVYEPNVGYIPTGRDPAVLEANQQRRDTTATTSATVDERLATNNVVHGSGFGGYIMGPVGGSYQISVVTDSDTNIGIASNLSFGSLFGIPSAGVFRTNYVVEAETIFDLRGRNNTRSESLNVGPLEVTEGIIMEENGNVIGRVRTEGLSTGVINSLLGMGVSHETGNTRVIRIVNVNSLDAALKESHNRFPMPTGC